MGMGKITQSKEVRNEIVATFAKCLIVLSVLLVLSMIIVKLFVDIEDVERIVKYISSDDEISSPVGAPEKSIWLYWFHNSRANLIYILLGFIPFLYIPVIGLCMNAVLQGAVCAFLSIAVNKGLLVCFIYGYGAHGIIENFANLLGYTLGILIGGY